MNLKQILRWLRRERHVEHRHYPDGSEEVFVMRATPRGWAEDWSIEHIHLRKTGDYDDDGLPIWEESEVPNRPGRRKMSQHSIDRLTEKTNTEEPE